MKAFSYFISVILLPSLAWAQEKPKTKEEMQRSLNQQVMAAPFDPGDIQRAQAYAEEAKQKGVVPEQRPPSYWQPGWTCNSLTLYPFYNYSHYRGCVYHHYYYGRYWR